ncbi:MAG TPA: IPExxxVDY family protein [Bacteroidetes bacterium]|nr:IPExxxVDY family protein [Bacteroidota bacterium]
MAKKLFLEGDFFEGYYLLGIVCGQPDYRLTHFINQNCGLNLKKYKNFSPQQEAASGFSWFHYPDEKRRTQYYFMQNKNGEKVILASLRKFDYLLLIYGNAFKGFLEELLADLRKTPYVVAVFELDLNKLKMGALFIEKNELHALEQLGRQNI